MDIKPEIYKTVAELATQKIEDARQRQWAGLVIRAHNIEDVKTLVQAGSCIMGDLRRRPVYGESCAILCCQDLDQAQRVYMDFTSIQDRFNRSLIKAPFEKDWLQQYMAHHSAGIESLSIVMDLADREKVDELVGRENQRKKVHQGMLADAAEVRRACENLHRNDWIRAVAEYLHANWSGFDDYEVTLGFVDQFADEVLKATRKEILVERFEFRTELGALGQKNDALIEARDEVVPYWSPVEKFQTEVLNKNLHDFVYDQQHQVVRHLVRHFKDPESVVPKKLQVVDQSMGQEVFVDKPLGVPNPTYFAMEDVTLINNVTWLDQISLEKDQPPFLTLMNRLASNLIAICKCRQMSSFKQGLHELAAELDKRPIKDELVLIEENSRPKW